MTDKAEYLLADGDELIREVTERMSGHWLRIERARQRNAAERHILEQEAQRFAEYAPQMQKMTQGQGISPGDRERLRTVSVDDIRTREQRKPV